MIEPGGSWLTCIFVSMHRLSTIFCLISCLCLGGIIAALVLVYELVYRVEIDHSHQSICNVTQCSVTTSTCQYEQCSTKICYPVYYTCYDLSVVLVLTITQMYQRGVYLGAPGTYSNFYGGSFTSPPSTCQSNQTTCYYDDQSISSSITLTANDPLARGIAGIVVCSIALAIFAIIALVASIIWCSDNHIVSKLKNLVPRKNETPC